MQKYSINFIALILVLFSLPVFSEPPTLLELRLMQSREYSISKVDFLEAASETCRARGGQLAGFYPFKNPGMSDAHNKYMYNMSLSNFHSGNIICVNYTHGKIAAKKNIQPEF